MPYDEIDQTPEQIQRVTDLLLAFDGKSEDEQIDLVYAACKADSYLIYDERLRRWNAVHAMRMVERLRLYGNIRPITQ